MSRNREPLHVVFGAGQIGNRVVEILRSRGDRVRQVRRTAAAGDASVLAGDARDLDFARRAGEGATVVYDCMNPAYHRWPQELLAIAAGSLEAARHAGARLVALDCLYMYGRPEGPMREDSPLRPCSKKGELRVRLAEMRMAAHRAGDVPVTIGRAADFVGADLPNSLFSERFFSRILAGKKAEVFGDPDLPHSYTSADDVARALVTLGDRDESLGRVWHLPTAPAESTRKLVHRFGRALGVAGDVTVVPRWAVRAIGIVSPLMREIAEMIYQWEVPYVLDDSRFLEAFGGRATPLEETVARTVAWARTRFGVTGTAAA